MAQLTVITPHIWVKRREYPCGILFPRCLCRVRNINPFTLMSWEGGGQDVGGESVFWEGQRKG